MRFKRIKTDYIKWIPYVSWFWNRDKDRFYLTASWLKFGFYMSKGC